MGFIDKLKKWTNLDEYEEDAVPETREEEPVAAPEEKSNPYSFESFSKSRNRVTTINTTTKLQVVLVKPTDFDDAAAIADDLKQSHTVVLNLEATNRDTARRLLDFLSGVAYAISGKIQRIANNTFIIVPFNVGISGDIMDELENSGISF
ncbi:MAG: cell division protein SepF [Clostridia bacterium]|nr:cell division protein SepF [Clostridia bacterium]